MLNRNLILADDMNFKVNKFNPKFPCEATGVGEKFNGWTKSNLGPKSRGGGHLNVT